MDAIITGIGSALPEAVSSQRFWEGYYKPLYGQPDRRSERRAGLIFRSGGVEGRHLAVDPTVEDLTHWSTAARMKRFATEAPPLGIKAVANALADAGVTAEEVDELVVATCTGYGAPGLDAWVAEGTGMREDVGRTHIGHMGCFAALPALRTASDAVAARGKVAVVLCLELVSLHVQPYLGDFEAERDQVVSAALFADAAAALVLTPSPGEDTPGDDAPQAPRVIGFQSLTNHESASLMSWDVTDLGFRMGLSPAVPKALGRHVSRMAERLLVPEGLDLHDLSFWAVHPGGPEILDTVAKEFQIPDEMMRPSWSILHDCGNCSSATVLLILERLLRGGGPIERQARVPGEVGILMAFGPGLSAHAALLRV